jgi:ectoine hydroxylase
MTATSGRVARAAFGELGYHVEESLFDTHEVEELRDVAEDVAARVAAHARRDGAGPEGRLGDGHRIQFSSRTAIQWEWQDGSDEIRLIEPADHLDPRIDALFADERLTAPVKRELGVDELARFTSKLNLKRAREGSEFPWHQDYPYWYVAAGTQAQDVITAILFLDDADEDNGALRVLPGSHRNGSAPRNPHDPTRFLTDPSRLDPDQVAREVVVEVPAGTVIWFGAFLVHRSSPNRSGRHRRALLPSWQPAGRPRLHDLDYRPERVIDLP